MKTPSKSDAAADNKAPTALLGSSVQPAHLDIGGTMIALGDIVAAAQSGAGLSVAQWNALPEADRESRIASEIAARRLRAATVQDDPAATSGRGAHSPTTEPAPKPAVELLGSSLHPGPVTIGDRVVPVAEIVAQAQASLGLTPAEWNALPDHRRGAIIGRNIAARIAAAAPPRVPVETSLALLGSSLRSDPIDIGGTMITQGELVAAAQARAGLSAEAWNAQAEPVRDKHIAAEIARRRATPAARAATAAAAKDAAEERRDRVRLVVVADRAGTVLSAGDPDGPLDRTPPTKGMREDIQVVVQARGMSALDLYAALRRLADQLSAGGYRT